MTGECLHSVPQLDVKNCTGFPTFIPFSQSEIGKRSSERGLGAPTRDEERNQKSKSRDRRKDGGMTSAGLAGVQPPPLFHAAVHLIDSR